MQPNLKKNKWLKNRYLSYNRLYFHNSLPPDLPVSFTNPGGDCYACTIFNEEGLATEIRISPELRRMKDYICMILLHEMCHVSVGNKERAYHGALWRKERQRLIESGAFTNLL